MTDNFRIDADASGVVARMGSVKRAVHQRILVTVHTWTQALRNHIVNDKLSGQVLQRRTGNLARSIRTQVIDSDTNVVGIVGTGGVPYARIQNYGGKTAAHVIEAKNGGTLAFMIGGKMIFRKKVNHPGSNIPARNYMESSLEDLRAEIIGALTAAAHEGAQVS